MGDENREKEFVELLENNKKLQLQLKTATDRVGMLEAGMELKTTSTQKIHKLDADSLEIGNQATGRIKVYGDFSNKGKFSAKLKDAFDVLAGAMEKKRELDGNGEEKKPDK